MKLGLFFILMVFGMIIPANAAEVNPDTLETLDKIEDKIKQQMKLKSQMPETMQNSVDYWCLNDHLTKITDAKAYDGYSDGIPVKDYDKASKIIEEKYSSKDNYVFSNDFAIPIEVWLHEDIQYTRISMDGDIPLKMLKAQAILDNYKIPIDRVLVLGSSSVYTQPCHNILENILNTTHSDGLSYKHKLMMNVRGDVVNIFHTSILELFERGYIVMRY